MAREPLVDDRTEPRYVRTPTAVRAPPHRSRSRATLPGTPVPSRSGHSHRHPGSACRAAGARGRTIFSAVASGYPWPMVPMKGCLALAPHLSRQSECATTLGFPNADRHHRPTGPSYLKGEPAPPGQGPPRRPALPSSPVGCACRDEVGHRRRYSSKGSSRPSDRLESLHAKRNHWRNR